MKTIPLNMGYVAIVDDEDFEALSSFKWRALVQGSEENRRVYAVSGKLRMHREVWMRAHGSLPQEIDHIEPGDHGGLDNRRSNLRPTTKALNQANSRKPRNNTSGYKGVWWQKQARRWRADLIVNGRKQHLGYFDNKEEAARSYDVAAVAAFGSHARVNFPAGGAA